MDGPTSCFKLSQAKDFPRPRIEYKNPKNSRMALII